MSTKCDENVWTIPIGGNAPAAVFRLRGADGRAPNLENKTMTAQIRDRMGSGATGNGPVISLTDDGRFVAGEVVVAPDASETTQMTAGNNFGVQIHNVTDNIYWFARETRVEVVEVV